MSKAGKFEIEVSSGYPYWITIKHEGKEVLHGMHHTELTDLKYAVEKAQKEGYLKAHKEDKKEFYL